MWICGQLGACGKLSTYPQPTPNLSGNSWDSIFTEKYLHYHEQRAAIKTVSMDMWGPYRSFFKKYLPKAHRVADRFHVVQQLNKQLGKARLAYQRRSGEDTQKALR
ncbi:MAG TPA: hypothetical protein EYH05_17790 [Anaerolineae bacterium]|nr:hypothetical protein [Anaerolineae bacterium]